MESSLPNGFVHIYEVDTDIIQCLRYSTSENFTGVIVDGYKGHRAILTIPAAQALHAANKIFRANGYQLFVYDAYRPCKAVVHFMRWSQDVSDQIKQHEYYPYIEKERVFELGYVTERSGHSRGSTVDVTIIEIGKSPHFPPSFTVRDINNRSIPYLDDGTVDMGGSFDLFDQVSHFANADGLTEQQRYFRNYLQETMMKVGFKPYSEEWWHFTLENEPYTVEYFDFDVE